MPDVQPPEGDRPSGEAPEAPAPITCSGGIRLPLPSPAFPKE
jgi:hypothetical protein